MRRFLKRALGCPILAPMLGRRLSVLTTLVLALGACGGSASSRDGGGDAETGGRDASDAAAEAGSQPDSQAEGGGVDGSAADTPAGADADAHDGAPLTVDAGQDAAPTADGGGADGSAPGEQWGWMGAPVGAPISALAFDEKGTLLAGSNANNVGFDLPLAGLFASDDQGVSWRPLNQGLRNFRIQSLATSPHAWFAGSEILVRSTDRGASWQQVAGVEEDVSAMAAQGTLVATTSDAYPSRLTRARPLRPRSISSSPTTWPSWETWSCERVPWGSHGRPIVGRPSRVFLGSPRARSWT